MKPWALALGLSLALHLGLVLAFRGEDRSPSPLKGERVGVRGDTFISFTPVSEVEPKKAAPVTPRGLIEMENEFIPVHPERSRGATSRGLGRPSLDSARDERGSGPGSANPTADVLPEVTSPSTPLGVSGEGPSTPLGVSGEGPSTPLGVSGNTGPSTPANGAEVELSALVHARLAAMADRCYPAAARRFRQRGTVHLSFCTDANGATASRSVTQSSGAELLDAAARGCVVESAAPFPPEAASRCFSVPVRFGARQ